MEFMTELFVLTASVLTMTLAAMSFFKKSVEGTSVHPVKVEVTK